MKRFSIVILLIHCLLPSFGQINQFGIPFFKNYSPKEYNASEQNWAAVQDLRGVMYFGNNDNGVLEYDGNSWNQIPISNNSIVRSLACDNKGRVYVGAVGEFGYLKPNNLGKIIYSSLSQKLDSVNRSFSDVWKTYCKGDTIYFSCSNNVYEYNRVSKKIRIIPLSKSGFLSFLINNELYNGDYYQGLLHLEKDSFRLALGGEFFKGKDIFTILTYDTENLIVSTMAEGLFKYNFKSGIVEPLANNNFTKNYNQLIAKSQLYQAVSLPNASYGLSTLTNGFLHIDKNENIIHYINKSVGLQDETVISQYHNSNSDILQLLWLTLNNGISSVEINSPIKRFGEESGLKGWVFDIVRFQGVMYFATSIGVYYLQESDLQSPKFVAIPSISAQSFDFLTINDSKEIPHLFVSTGSGIYEIKKNETKSYFPNLYCYKLYASKVHKNQIITGLSNGLAFLTFENEKLEFQGRKSGINLEIRFLEQENNGTIWLGTHYDGVIRLATDSTITNFTLNDGLKSLKDNTIFQLDNTIYFANEKGIFTFDAQQSKFMPSHKIDAGFANGNKGLFLIKEDQNKNLWVQAYNSTKKWIEFYKKGENGYILDSVSFKRFPNLSFQIIYPDSQVVWFGTGNGVFCYKAESEINYQQKYNTLIRKIVASNDSILFQGTNFEVQDSDFYTSMVQNNNFIPNLAYHYNALTFYYSAAYYVDEKSTLYSHYLEGFETNWSKWNSEPKTVYTNLSEGKYIFHVKAKNIYGVESEVASYQFVIQPPWYRTIWAYIFYIILAGLAVWGFIQIYTRRLRHEKIRLEILVQQRTIEVVRQKDEIEKQAETLKQANEEITFQNKEITEQKEEIEEKNKSITSSITYAKRIQTAVLPPTELINEAFPEHFILYMPKDIVSGDFYWFREVKSADYLAYVIAAADCTGHGVPGAFMSMLGMGLLNEIVSKIVESVGANCLTASTILNHLRKEIKNSLRQTGKDKEQKDGMDIALCIYEPSTLKLQYAGANNPLLLIHNSELIENKADKMPIGIYINEKDSFTNHNIQLEPNDIFYIFSDGYVDQFGGENGKKFMIKVLRQLLFDIHQKPLAEQKELLLQEHLKWRGVRFEQVDDITVIGVKVK